ncbi:MAG: hypothetical protein EA409_00440 [Saprospirales bacterium]|nr:MAG: hypothetical protein EA409_00440 [Saprospirales bacterium]
MGTNRLKLWWLVLVVPFLIGCPFGEERCPFNDWERVTTIEDLITLFAMEDTFNLGEVVTFELTIPDSVFIYDTIVFLYSETGDHSPKLITDNRLFLNNSLGFEHGYQGDRDNWFHLEFLPEKKKYNLRIMVELSKLGNFELANASSRVIFKGRDKCNWYEIRTNIKEFSGRGHWITYTVVP